MILLRLFCCEDALMKFSKLFFAISLKITYFSLYIPLIQNLAHNFSFSYLSIAFCSILVLNYHHFRFPSALSLISMFFSYFQLLKLTILSYSGTFFAGLRRPYEKQIGCKMMRFSCSFCFCFYFCPFLYNILQIL